MTISRVMCASDNTVHVFSGPSLYPDNDAASWASRLEASTEHVRWHGPVHHGSLLALQPKQSDVVVIIDGYFFRQASIRHKEILHFMESGVVVVGAASMGALRAAELEDYGMIGVGEIFESYSSGRRCRDDDVMVAHQPEPPFCSHTMSTVEFEAWIDGLQPAVDARLRATLLDEFRSIPFWQRTFQRAAAVARNRHIPSGSITAPGVSFGSLKLGPKERDARQAVTLGLQLAGGETPRNRLHPYDGQRWDTTMFHSWMLASTRLGVDCASMRDVMDFARLFSASFLAWWAEVATSVTNDPNPSTACASVERIRFTALDHSELVHLPFWAAAREEANRALEFDNAIRAELRLPDHQETSISVTRQLLLAHWCLDRDSCASVLQSEAQRRCFPDFEAAVRTARKFVQYLHASALTSQDRSESRDN